MVRKQEARNGEDGSLPRDELLAAPMEPRKGPGRQPKRSTGKPVTVCLNPNPSPFPRTKGTATIKETLLGVPKIRHELCF